MTEAQVRQDLDESMPDIIEAMRYKIGMYEREITTARVFGGTSNGNRLHIVNCRTELDKTQALLSKLEVRA